MKETNGIPKDTITRLEQVRANNNSLWMELLRIAVKYGEGREIARKILENDKKIMKIWEELLE